MGQGINLDTDTAGRYGILPSTSLTCDKPTKPQRKKFRPTKGAFGKQVK